MSSPSTSPPSPSRPATLSHPMTNPSSVWKGKLADLVLGSLEDCSKTTSSETVPGPFRGYLGSLVRFSNPRVPLWGRWALSGNCGLRQSHPVFLSHSVPHYSLASGLCLHVSLPRLPNLFPLARPGVFSALVLRRINAVCIESCKR